MGIKARGGGDGTDVKWLTTQLPSSSSTIIQGTSIHQEPLTPLLSPLDHRRHRSSLIISETPPPLLLVCWLAVRLLLLSSGNGHE